jgi:tetratricopeptide (TPR) repeat protein
MPLLDLRKCKGEELWVELNPELRSLLAKAVVFRRPFKRRALPQTNVSLLPEDKEGMVDMPPSLRLSVPSLMDRSTLKEAHSFAADYWLAEGDHVERLHHLLEAERSLEAQMLLVNHGRQLSRSCGPELLGSLKAVNNVLPRYAREIRWIKGQAAMRAEDQGYGLQMADEMLMTGDAEEMLSGLMLKGNLLLRQGKAKEALDNLQEVARQRPSPLLDCDIAMGLCLTDRKEEALRLLDSVGRKGGHADPDLLEEVYVRKAEVLACAGRREEALANYSKALGLARPGDKRDIYRAMASCYEALGMTDKARECSRKAVSRR